MGKFKVNDRVVSACGATGTVVGVTDTARVLWDGWAVEGTWPVSMFELLARKFKTGQYVRVISPDEYENEVGFIFEDDGDDEENMPYEVALFDDDETEEFFSASELIPWVPFAGELVIEANNEAEEDEVGTVLSCDGITARVLWPSFPLAQDWPVGDLEPSVDEDTIDIGDRVKYNHPLFYEPQKGVVIGAIGYDHVKVEFDDSHLATAYYNRELFSKAA